MYIIRNEITGECICDRSLKIRLFSTRKEAILYIKMYRLGYYYIIEEVFD